jgi:hypothetical protein
VACVGSHFELSVLALRSLRLFLLWFVTSDSLGISSLCMLVPPSFVLLLFLALLGPFREFCRCWGLMQPPTMKGSG